MLKIRGNAMKNLQPTLEDDLVFIRPLLETDFEDLYQVAKDPLIWEQHPAWDRYKREVFEKLFQDFVESKATLIIIDKTSGAVIGSSRYNPVPGVDSAVEIGWTFLSRKYWGGKFNSAVKKLMMDHAFQFYNSILFHVGKENYRSQKAVEKLGCERVSEIDHPELMKRPEENFTYRIIKGDYFS